MKKYLLWLWVSILAFVFTGCEAGDDPPPIFCNLQMDVRSASGAPLCDRLLGSYVEAGQDYPVSNVFYKHRLEGKGLLPVFPLRVHVDEDKHASIYQGFVMKGKLAHQITYYLVCSALFGDEDEHAIVSYWSLDERHDLQCDRVLVDGREIPVQPGTVDRMFFKCTLVTDVP